MTFTDFVCLLLGGAARPAGGAHGRASGRTGRQAVAGREAGGAHGRQSPAHVHKNAVGRRECTGPQPFGQNTSLNPNLAQLSSSSRPNHT